MPGGDMSNSCEMSPVTTLQLGWSKIAYVLLLFWNLSIYSTTELMSWYICFAIHCTVWFQSAYNTRYKIGQINGLGYRNSVAIYNFHGPGTSLWTMCFYEASHVLTRNMAEFKAKLENFAAVFKSFTDEEKNLAIETILKICGPEQLRMLSDELQSLVKRDFIKFLPTELAFNVVKFLDYHTVGLCCLVSKAWNTILSNNTEIWSRSCKRLGVVSWKLTTIDGINWKLELKQALRRIKRFRRYRVSGFAKRELDAHTRRVTALCYKDGLLASG